jgi:hypothetical protein
LAFIKNKNSTHKNFMDKNSAIIPLDPTDANTKALMDGWTDGGKYTLEVTYSANPPQMTVDSSEESENPAEDNSPAEEAPEQGAPKSKNPAVAMLITNAGKNQPQ